MTEFWENAFIKKQLMWGLNPTASALIASEYFARMGAREILIPGIGYGRNAMPFVNRGMSVTGIEISETAIAAARSQLGLQSRIHHGSVTDMPYDNRLYDGIFCYGLVYLLDSVERQKFILNCYRQVRLGGHMVFTVISKKAPMYGQGTRLGRDWYERLPNLSMYFYDAESVEREFGLHGLVDFSEVDEPSYGGTSLPFINVLCGKNTDPNATAKGLNAGHSNVTVDGLLDQNQMEATAEALKTSNSTILRMGDCQIGDTGGKAI